MAIIRPATENTVDSRAATGARFQAADFDTGETVGRAVSRLGGAGQDFAQGMHEIELRDAETAARDADNQAQAQKLELYYSGENAFFNLQGRQALDAHKDVIAKREQIDRDTEARLAKDPYALRMFKEVSARRRLADDERIAQHVSKERVRYEDQVFEQGVGNAISGATAAADNPAEIERNLSTIESLVEQRAARRGLAQPGTEEMKALQKRALSGAVGAVAERIRLTSPGEAQAFITAHADRVDPVELTKLLGAIDEEAAAEQADGLVDNFLVYTSVEQQLADPSLGTAESGPVSPTAVPPMAVQIAAVAGHESGNRERDAQGRLITSPKGAQGRMQVMPRTNADPGYGVRPARDGSDAERTRVGQDYYKAMLKEYGGNMVLALAAYNAGPGNVDKWIKQYGDPRTGKISDGAWINAIPVDETRKYVPSVLKRMGVAPGKSATATPEAQSPTYAGEEINLTATINKIDNSREYTYVEKQALKAAARERYGLGRQARADAEARVKDAAVAAMTAMGENYTSYDQLPLNVRQQLEAMPELKAAAIGSANANREAKAREARAAEEGQRRAIEGELKLDMIELQQTDPDAFLRQDFRDIKKFPNLDYGTRAELMERQGTIARQREAEAKSDARQTSPDMGQIRRLSGQFAGADSGMSNSRRATPEQRQNRIMFVDTVSKRVEMEQRRLGRRMTDAEVADIMQNVALAPVTVIDPDGGWFGARETTAPAYLARQRAQAAGPDGQIKFNLPADVPKSEANTIARQFMQQQGYVPDPDLIRRIYRAAHP